MNSAVFSSGSFPPRMSRRVCWGNPKGLSQRSHLFRRPARQRSTLKGCMERSAGISWGSCWAILCRSPMTKQPWGLQAVTAGLGCSVYSERTLNPAQPPRPLCFPPTSYSDSLHHHSYHLFVWTWPMWPSIQMRAQGGFLRCCVYTSSLTAP